MVLRQRKKNLSKVVQEMDAFPKIPDTYIEEKTKSGASIFMLTTFLVCLLIWSEMRYFLNPGFKFRFVPDTDFESKLKINVDMTIATPCSAIGADIVDSSNQNTFKFGQLKEEDTWWELDHLQRQHFESIRTFNQYLREEYHALQNLLWASGSSSMYGQLPPRRNAPDEPHDACRVYGSLTLNKVSGNFHVSPGKSVPLVRGHAHLSAFNQPDDYNFTHRIDRFSFGSPHGGIIQPLEGEEKITDKHLVNYQYIVQIVPTDVQGYSDSVWSTFQYSVKEHYRPLDGGRGVPGIYFKYDMSALKVIAAQDREPLWQFLVRLVAGVGGLVSTSQIICGLIKPLVNFICCRKLHHQPIQKPQQQTSPKVVDLLPKNERISLDANKS